MDHVTDSDNGWSNINFHPVCDATTVNDAVKVKVSRREMYQIYSSICTVSMLHTVVIKVNLGNRIKFTPINLHGISLLIMMTIHCHTW
jgi:hypothetical protein